MIEKDSEAPDDFTDEELPLDISEESLSDIVGGIHELVVRTDPSPR
jgi:hypothetical protein